MVGTRSGTRSRAIRRRMFTKKAQNSKQEKLMARASAPKEQEPSQKQQKEASRRAAPDARERIPTGAGGAVSVLYWRF